MSGHRVVRLVLAALGLLACSGKEDGDLERDPNKGFLSGTVTIGYHQGGVVTAAATREVSGAGRPPAPSTALRDVPLGASWTERALPSLPAGRRASLAGVVSRIPSPLWRTGVLPGELLVQRRPGPAALGALSMPSGATVQVRALPQPHPSVEHVVVRHPDGGRLSDDETVALAERLSLDPQVVRAEPNRWVFPAAVPNDTWTPLMWSYEMMRVPQAWDHQPDARDIVVAVLDTGVVPDHPDLVNTLLPGIDMISDPAVAGDGDGRDLDPTDEGGDWEDGSSTWHGTHVGGTIAAETHNALGIPSVTWKSAHLPVRVLGKGGGDVADILAAISWSAGLQVGALPVNPHPAHVMNLSLGALGSPSQIAQSVIDEVTAAGHFLVVAAGNDGVDSTGSFPCNQQQVICVASVGQNGKRATYSNYGAAVTLAAPGGMLTEDLDRDGTPDGVLSSSGLSGGYIFQQGTSMATPQVSGLVALVLQAHLDTQKPLPTFEALRDLLTGTATPLPALCPEGCGAGLVNAERAVLAARGNGAIGITDPGQLEVATTPLQLATSGTAQLHLANVGGTSLLVAAAFSSPTAGLALDFPGDHTLWIAPSGSAVLNLAWRPASLETGTHSGTLHLTPSVGARVDVPVEVTVQPPVNAGQPIEVTVSTRLTGSTWKPVERQIVKAEDGYAYRFQLFPGSYRVTAAIDEDGDGVFSEEGERRGGYPLFEQPTLVSLSKQADVTGIDFLVGSRGAAPDLTGTKCATDAECGPGGQCITGGTSYCTAKCGWSFPACPSGSTCLWNDEEPGLCVRDCTPDSTVQGSCRSGQSCVDAGGSSYICYPD